jgi:hypothetical protein
MFHLHRWCEQEEIVHATYVDGTDIVPKRRDIKFKGREITQKKEYIVHDDILRQRFHIAEKIKNR